MQGLRPGDLQAGGRQGEGELAGVSKQGLPFVAVSVWEEPGVEGEAGEQFVPQEADAAPHGSGIFGLTF